MATIKDRIMQMERAVANNKQRRPIPYYILPAISDPSRADIQTAIAKRELEGQAFIAYEIVD